MPAGQSAALLRHLRRLAVVPPATPLTDRDLLLRFAAGHDEAAFAMLLQRHGPMVLRVCRRIAGNAEDAEDAFQATFLVLARKAASLAWHESAAGWLHAVAHRLAQRARVEAVRRSSRERRAVGRPAGDVAAEVSWREAQALLDEELNRLPAAYRDPLVLCYLEGATRDEAAGQLGWSLSTFKRRLERGRELLRVRLSRRGLALSAVLPAALLPGETVAAALAGTTLRAVLTAAAGKSAAGLVSAQALALAQGAAKALFAGKVKLTAALLLLAAGLALGGVGAYFYPGLALEQSPAPRAEAPPEPAEPGADAPPREDKPAPALDQDGNTLPPGAVARLGSLRFAHGGAVWSVAFAPDGLTVASGSDDATIRLWDVHTGREVRRFTGEQPWVKSVAFAPDGKLLASGHYDRLRLWDPATGREVHPFGQQNGPGYCVAFSPDGKLLAAASTTDLVTVWDVPAGRRLRQFQIGQVFIEAVAFSPDNKTLALACRDKTVRLWDAAAGTELRCLEGHGEEVMAVAFSPDGKRLASGSKDRTVRLWDPATGKELARLHGHKFWVEAVAFAPDGKFLVSGGRDWKLCTWEVATGKEVRSSQAHQAPVTAVAFAPGRGYVATGGLDDMVRLQSVLPGKEHALYTGDQDKFTWLDFGPDGRALITADGGTVRFWEPLTGRRLRQFGSPQERIIGASLSADGTLLAAGSMGGAIRLWDVAGGKEVRQLKGHGTLVTSTAFAPDGRILASASYDNSLRLWDVAGGKELRRLQGQRVPQNVVFAPDGRTLASSSTDASGDFSVRLWDVATGQQRWVVTTQPWSAFRIAFSPDGKLLAVVGGLPGRLNETGEVRLWDAATGKELCRCDGHKERVGSVAFSRDGRTLATGSQDNTVRLWEVATGGARGQFTGHQNWIPWLAFSPDGRLLASAGMDNTALVWDLTGRCRGGRFVPRPLSAKELEGCWADLAAADAGKAYQAVRSLTGAPQAVPFLRDRLRPELAADPKRIAAWLRDLDSNDFAVREEASRQLEKAGSRAEPALREALAGKPAPEVRRRLTDLLEKLDPAKDPEKLRALRAVEVLEATGTPEAREVLERLARQASGGWLTEEVKASLTRLDKRPAAAP